MTCRLLRGRLAIRLPGLLLALTLTGGDRNHVTQLLPLLEAIPSIGVKRGLRPDVVLALPVRGRMVRHRRRP